MSNVNGSCLSSGMLLPAGINRVTFIFLKVSVHCKKHHGSLLSSLEYRRNVNSSSKCFFPSKFCYFERKNVGSEQWKETHAG